METTKGNLFDKSLNIKIQEKEYILNIILNKDNNLIILVKSIDISNKIYYKFESSIDNLKSLKYKYFKIFDSMSECIQDIYEFLSSKESKFNFVFEENESILSLNFSISIGAKTENLELKLKKLELSEKEIISNLSEKINFLTKKVEILEKENEQFKQNNNLMTNILNEIKRLKEEILIPYTIDSKIITSSSQLNLIKSGIKNSNNKIIFKLLFRGTRDGDKVSDFHKYCDGIPNTLSVIQTSKGYIFGGYTEMKWDSTSGCVQDPNTFIFSLDYMKIYKPKSGNTGYIHCAKDHGPYFCDTIGMMDSYFSSNSHYEQNLNTHYEGEEQGLNHGEKNFIGREVEVFQVFLI